MKLVSLRRSIRDARAFACRAITARPAGASARLAALIVLAGFLAGLLPAAFANTLDVPVTGQEQANWCWAACTKAILAYYGKPVAQAHIATVACRRAGWCTVCDAWNDPSNTSCCNRANYLYYYSGSIVDLFSQWGLGSWAGPWTLNFDQVKEQINVEAKPFIMRWEWSGGGGHFLVARGVSGTDKVHYMDPLPVGAGSYHIETHAWVLSNGTHTWTHTLKLSTAYPPTTYAVYATGSGVYPTIQSAINAAQDMDAVALFPGTYTGPGNRNIYFGGKRIRVYSLGGPDNTIIDCQGVDRAFVFQGETPGAMLEGVTIRNGHTSDYGGAVNCLNASPTISDCKFTENGATYHGGAIYGYSNSSPTIIGCSFTENTAGMSGGAVGCNQTSGPTLVASGFSNNSADQYGGAVWCENNDIPANPTVMILKDCSLLENSTGGAGGGIYAGRKVTTIAVGSTFAGNSAFQGGAIDCNDQCPPTLRRCSLYDNAASTVGGGLFLNVNSAATIDHTIIAHSTQGEGIYCQNNSTPTLSCSDIYGNAGGNWQGYPFAGQLNLNGNIESDPYICRNDNPAQPYALHANSPCAARNNATCKQIGAWGVGCGYQVIPGLGGGVIIAHAVPGMQYSAGGDGCAAYNGFAIHSCEQQINRIDSRGPSVWYILCAWDTEKEFCATQFGLGGYDPGAFEVVEYGACGPQGMIEVPSPGWPNPGTGTTLVADAGTSWSGNFVPVYWFWGYVNGPTLIPLAENPTSGSAGWLDCGGEQWAATCTGAMGVLMDGIACCPEGLTPQVRACCFADGSCELLIEGECGDAGGVWHADEPACDPNPCPPPVAVCCADNGCMLITEAECLELSGTWHGDWASCRPDPCEPLVDWTNHDVGNCVLTVTDQGILGFMDASQAEGSGFIYPSGGANNLFVGGLWVGGDTANIANRDYDGDPAREWSVSTSPDGHVWIDEGGTSHLDVHASYTDSAAVQPRGLFVDQESWSFTNNEVADDLVIIRYTIRNDGPDPQSGLYAADFLDLDVGTYYQNTGATDPAHDLVYLTGSTGVYAGVRLLREEDGGPPLANLSLIDNETYVWPLGYIPDADKYGFLSAGAPEYVLATSPEPNDYGVLASAGPFDLGPGEERLVSFAVLGGASLDELKQSAHVAQLLYLDGFADVSGEWSSWPTRTRLLPCEPNPFRQSTRIRLDLAREGQVRVDLYDIAGRRLRTLVDEWLPPMHFARIWDGRDAQGRPLPGGVYFLGMKAAGERHETRVILLR